MGHGPGNVVYRNHERGADFAQVSDPIQMDIFLKFAFLNFPQIFRGRERESAEECDAGDDEHVEGLAGRAQEESISDQRREDNVGHHYENDADPSLDLVC